METFILVADDHSIVRKGLISTLKYELHYSNIQAVDSCGGIMRELRNARYTHLLLDVNMPDGSSLEIIPNIRAAYPELRIAIFSMLPASIFRKTMKANSIYFAINKNANEDDVTRLLSQFLQNSRSERADLIGGQDNPFSTLTSRENEVLHYILKGERTNAIAAALNLAPQSVSTLKSRIYERTGVKNDRDLLRLAQAFQVGAE